MSTVSSFDCLTICLVIKDTHMPLKNNFETVLCNGDSIILRKLRDHSLLSSVLTLERILMLELSLVDAYKLIETKFILNKLDLAEPEAVRHQLCHSPENVIWPILDPLLTLGNSH